MIRGRARPALPRQKMQELKRNLMIYRVAILSAALLAGMGLTIPIYAAGISNIQIVKGSCETSSNTAEGPLGSDLTKRQSRFYCDSAIITFFDDYAGHVMIQFAQKESQHSPILGFAGRIEAPQPGDVGTMMQVDSVYLARGQATTVSEGSCKLFLKDRHLTGIGCGMKVDETGRRTVAVVVFNATPGQGVSISTPPPSNPPPDEHTIGSADDIWQKVQSDGREIYVKTNGRYYTTERSSGHAFQSGDGKTSSGWDTIKKRLVYGFDTYIVANLPESDIVGAPQSIMHEVEGDCETRTYHVLGSLFFAGKNRSGVAMQDMPPQEVERTLVPNSPFEKAFDMLCKIAREQK
jgi:hypothetical protein